MLAPEGGQAAADYKPALSNATPYRANSAQKPDTNWVMVKDSGTVLNPHNKRLYTVTAGDTIGFETDNENVGYDLSKRSKHKIR
jgi:uncharacterized cupin superfamily protein